MRKTIILIILLFGLLLGNAITADAWYLNWKAADCAETEKCVPEGFTVWWWEEGTTVPEKLTDVIATAGVWRKSFKIGESPLTTKIDPEDNKTIYRVHLESNFPMKIGETYLLAVSAYNAAGESELCPPADPHKHSGYIPPVEKLPTGDGYSVNIPPDQPLIFKFTFQQDMAAEEEVVD